MSGFQREVAGSDLTAPSLPTPHVLPRCDEFLYGARGGRPVDELASAVRGMLKAFNCRSVHRAELLFQHGELLTRERQVKLRTAAYIRLLFAT